MRPADWLLLECNNNLPKMPIYMCLLYIWGEMLCMCTGKLSSSQLNVLLILPTSVLRRYFNFNLHIMPLWLLYLCQKRVMLDMQCFHWSQNTRQYNIKMHCLKRVFWQQRHSWCALSYDLYKLLLSYFVLGLCLRILSPAQQHLPQHLSWWLFLQQPVEFVLVLLNKLHPLLQLQFLHLMLIQLLPDSEQ